MRRKKSPYLSSTERLSDILAAIQVMGSHRWDSREMKDWKMHLGDHPQSGATWEDVLSQHPEFFGTTRKDGGATYHFLRLRRSYERTVDPDTLRELTDKEIGDLKDRNLYDSARLSRKPLLPTQVEALMKTAVELQVRAAALDDRSKWWIPLAAGAFSLVGGLAGSLLKSPEPASVPPSAASSRLIPASPASTASSAASR